MSGGGIDADQVKSAIPLADLTIIDKALEGDDDALREAVKKVRPADIGRDLSRRSTADSCRLFQALDDRHGAAMLRAAHPAIAGKLLEASPSARAARVLGFMPTDHQVAVLAHVEPEPRTKIEQSMDAGDRDMVKRLLAYDELAVGRLMTPKLWRVRSDQTVDDAMTSLRKDHDEIEVATNLYVVDGDGKLVGVAPLRDVSIAGLTTKLADLMTPDPIAVHEDTPRGDAADIIRTHDFLSLPVVDDNNKLVGVVRVDDVLDAVLDRVGDGFLNQGGVAGKVAAQVPYFQTKLLRTVRSRLTWLILLFVAETATGTVLRYFEDELAKVVALSFFVPLLIGTGGNAGSQTVATIIRASALGEVRPSDVFRVIWHEVSAAILLGVLLALIAFGRALLWGVGMDLAFCVSITIIVVVIWANAVGAGIPLLAQRLGIDPTVISGPLITTLVDATGLFIYFTVAHLTIAQLHEIPTAKPYDCQVVEVQNQTATPIQACDPKDAKKLPCWRIDIEEGSTAPTFTLGIDRRGAPPPAGTAIETRCH
jgi:magnesium transporter